MHMRPECGIRGVFADHGVVADELDGQRIVVHQQLGRNGEVRLGNAAFGAAQLTGRGLDGREEGAVQDELDMAQLGQQAGRKRIVDVDLCGAHHVRLRQREVDGVAGVDAVQLDLRRARVFEREGVVELAGSDRRRRRGRLLDAGIELGWP